MPTDQPEIKVCRNCGPQPGSAWRRVRKKNASDRAWKKAHADYRREYTRNHIRAIREQVLYHYGGPNPSCACPSGACGETTVQFLCLDHIDGGGNHHRAQVGGGSQFYAWIVKNNFPSGFRILCHNCNFALGAYGVCPHSTDYA